MINSSIACCGPSAVLSCRAALLWEGRGSHVMSQAKVGSSTFLASTGHPEKFSNLLSPAPPCPASSHMCGVKENPHFGVFVDRKRYSFT